MEKKEIEEIRRLLSEADEEFETNPALEQDSENYRKKYANVSEEELNKQFTI